ncbi:MAG: response regulator, partial [Paludibacteraceae bacterium]|nr:response regulator [Paludibacteraceae bacterium]
IVVFALGACNLSANSVEYGFFDHYTTRNGLVSNRVFSMDQDANGFFWIGTDFGLERFDGKSFAHHRKHDYDHVSGEDFLFVRSLPNGRVAAGGYSGLLVAYSPNQDLFMDMKPVEDGKSFFQESMNIYLHKGNQYLYTSSGVYTYDSNRDCFAGDNLLYKVTEKLFVRAMHIDAKNRYWLGSMDSMVVYSDQGKRLYGYIPEGDACSFVRTMIPLNDSLLLVAGQTDEVWVFNLKEENISAPKVVKTPFDCITNMVCDEQGRFWIATDAHGLWYCDNFMADQPSFTHVIPFNASEDEVRKIYCITKDDKGDIWFGTQSSGVWRYRKHNATGITCSWNFGFPSVVCSAFMEDASDNMVVSVDGGGLYGVDGHYKVEPLAKFPNNNVSGIAPLSSLCYVATWGGGVYRYDLASGEYQREKFEGIHAPSNCFFTIKTLNGKDVVACSSGDGIYRKRASQNQWERILLHDAKTNNDDNWILSVCEGGADAMWILTSKGLWREEKGTLTCYLQSTDSVNAKGPMGIIDMVPDEKGGLVAATNRGIFHFSSQSLQPESLPCVPESYFRIITRDNQGIYWAAGDEGILSFDINRGECRRLPENYIDMQSFLFHPRSGYKAKDGKLYFGTNEGFISIDPNKLSFDTEIPYLALSHLYVKGEKVPVADAPLSGTPLSQSSVLKLKHGETDIAIDVDVIDYTDADRVQCQYRLCGLREEWQMLPVDKQLKFSHIPTGEYKLEVMAYRSNDACEPKVISLSVVVLPPWWNTWWFYGLMTVLLLLLILAIFKWRMKQLVAQKNFLNEQVSLRTLELQNALKDKDSLISVIGHDLKNPMFAIVVALENWLNKEQSMAPENKRSLIVEVHDSAKTLQGEMLKLLDWAQSKNDDLICKPQDFDVAPLVDDAIQLTAGLLKRKEIACEKNIRLEHKAYADARMISAVVRNLLGNAVKFTEAGGKITIGATQEGNIISLYVQDSGVGMTQEAIQRLLSGEKLESTDGTDHERGTGLGLSMCKKYVQLNNGTFSVASKEGEGTCITITMPASESKVVMESEVKQNAVDKSAETRECLADNVILMVDDNPLICENMKTLLSDFCEVLVAHNGQEALDIVKEKDIDLILSDVEMPVMNGIEMCCQLQNDEMFSHIPILFLSGRNDEHDRLLGLTNGAIDYISKPFSHEELLAKLRSIFKLRKQERAFLLAQLMKPKSVEEASLEETEETPPVVKEDPFVAKFMELVRERYTDTELSVDDLADVLCVSRSTMFRRVKMLVGKSPLELLNDYRLNEAMRLLKAHEFESISDVAYSVGFSDPSYFSKRFKSYFGVSPTQVDGN